MGETEAEIYQHFDFAYIEPELRELQGEFEAAKAGQLPHLVTLKDIKGDLQMHTTASDGLNSLEEMAAASQKLGYEYIAITDHSPAVRVAGGLSAVELKKHLKAIEQVDQKYPNLKIFKSAEVDILKDGSLDYPDEILALLDLVLVSVHSSFKLDEAKQTERILKAFDNPYVKIWAHPTGRLLLKREGIKVDLEKIMNKAKDKGIVMEINADPARLDLDDVNARRAKDLGLKISIATDAHDTQSLNFMKYGINQARRAWLEPKEVINTWNLEKLKKFLNL